METLRQIAELIEQNKSLEQRNEELKNILEINLSQTSNDTGFTFPEIAYLSDAKTLVVKFYQYNKIPVALFDEKGELIFSVGWKNEFTAFSSGYSDLFLEYLENERLSNKASFQKREHIFQRKNGMYAFTLPIEIKDKQIATLILSQFDYLDESAKIGEQEKYFDQNRETFNSFDEKIPLLSKKTLDSICQNASFLGEMISFLGLKNIEYHHKIRKQTDSDTVLYALHEKISEQEQIIKTLLQNINLHQNEVRENTISKTDFQQHQKRLIDRIKRTEALLNSLLTSMPLGIGFIRKHIFTYTNDQMFRITADQCGKAGEKFLRVLRTMTVVF